MNYIILYLHFSWPLFHKLVKFNIYINIFISSLSFSSIFLLPSISHSPSSSTYHFPYSLSIFHSFLLFGLLFLCLLLLLLYSLRPCLLSPVIFCSRLLLIILQHLHSSWISSIIISSSKSMSLSLFFQNAFYLPTHFSDHSKISIMLLSTSSPNVIILIWWTNFDSFFI